MIRIEINGEFQPLKKDGATPEDVKNWKKTDPLYLLRMALTNKLRSKHWRSAHAAKAKWMAAAEKHAQVIGNAAETPAFVVIEHALPNKCDSTLQSKYYSMRFNQCCSILETIRISKLLSSNEKSVVDLETNQR